MTLIISDIAHRQTTREQFRCISYCSYRVMTTIVRSLKFIYKTIVSATAFLTPHFPTFSLPLSRCHFIMESKFEFDASQHAIESVTIYRDGGAKVRFSHLILNIETTKWLTLWLYL